MSLEQAVLANTAAIEKLTALLAGGATIPPISMADTPVTSDGDKPSGKKVTGEVPKPTKVAKATAETVGKNEDPKLTYNDAAKAVVDLQKVKGTPAAKALLAKFGGKALAEVKPEKYGELIAEAQKELA
jgi:hypothetical protein